MSLALATPLEPEKEIRIDFHADEPTRFVNIMVNGVSFSYEVGQDCEIVIRESDAEV